MEYFLRDPKRLTATLLAAPLLTFLVLNGACAAETESLDFANGLYARKMYGPAASEYEKFTHDHPDSPEISSARFRCADSYYFLKNYPVAIGRFGSFVRDFSQDDRVPIALFRIAASKYHLGERLSAMRDFVALVRRATDPDVRAGSLFYIGRFCEERKFMGRAIRVYERLLSLYPKSEFSPYARLVAGSVAKSLLEAIQTHLDAGRFAEALDHASLFIRKFPKSDYSELVRYKQAVALAGLKRFKEAAYAFDGVTKDYPRSKLVVESLYGVATSLENNHDFNGAVAFYEKIVWEYPDHSLAADGLSRLRILYVRTDNLDRLAALHSKILFDETRPGPKLDEAFWLIQYFLDKRDYPKAKEVVQFLPGRFPQTDIEHETRYFLGECALGMKDHDAATGHFSEALRLRPQGSYAGQAHLGMGLAYAAKGDRGPAEKEFAEALRFDTKPEVTLRARFEIARMRLLMGDFPEGAKAFMLVAILYDDRKYTPLSLYKAGECFLKAGKPDDALKALEELRSRYPGSFWARKSRRLEKGASLGQGS